MWPLFLENIWQQYFEYSICVLFSCVKLYLLEQPWNWPYKHDIKLCPMQNGAICTPSLLPKQVTEQSVRSPKLSNITHRNFRFLSVQQLLNLIAWLWSRFVGLKILPVFSSLVLRCPIMSKTRHHIDLPDKLKLVNKQGFCYVLKRAWLETITGPYLSASGSRLDNMEHTGAFYSEFSLNNNVSKTLSITTLRNPTLLYTA